MNLPFRNRCPRLRQLFPIGVAGLFLALGPNCLAQAQEAGLPPPTISTVADPSGPISLSLPVDSPDAGQGAPAPDATANLEPALEPAVAAAVNALPQQCLVVSQQFSQELQSATPDGRLALLSGFRAQLDNLAAALPPLQASAPLGQPVVPDQSAQQLFGPSLPDDAQSALQASQQRQWMTQQVIAAPPEQRDALVAQLQQVVIPAPSAFARAMASPVGAISPVAGVDDSPAQQQAEFLAALPADQQAALQEMAQSRQAIKGVLRDLLSQEASAPAPGLTISPAPLAAPVPASNLGPGGTSDRVLGATPASPASSSN